jgi:hypothetical protein
VTAAVAVEEFAAITTLIQDDIDVFVVRLPGIAKQRAAHFFERACGVITQQVKRPSERPSRKAAETTRALQRTYRWQ